MQLAPLLRASKASSLLTRRWHWLLVVVTTLLINALVGECLAATPNWKCPPNEKKFCTLPTSFGTNIVGASGYAGCIAGTRIRVGAACAVRCSKIWIRIY
jgi:hypothetical protein